jgi:hypothetical protein
VNDSPWLNDHGMSTSTISRITLEIEAGGDPIRGVLEHSDGSHEPFWGWLELMDELRRVAAGKPTRAPSSQTRRAAGRKPSSTRQVKQPQRERTGKEQS